MEFFRRCNILENLLEPLLLVVCRCPRTTWPQARIYKILDVKQIIRSARAPGVELDDQEAVERLTAVAALEKEGSDLDRLSCVAAIVEIHDRPCFETAVSLSGSSALSHVHLFPGDFDYSERVNVTAASREKALESPAAGHPRGFRLSGCSPIRVAAACLAALSALQLLAYIL